MILPKCFIVCVFCSECFLKVCKDTVFFGACRIISYFCPFFVEKVPLNLVFMQDKQCTLKKRVSVKGAGLHTRQCGTLTFNPAPINSGIRFRRIDIETQPIIEADVDNVIDTARGTTLGKGGVKIYTVEHVLAALRGMGIDNVLIDIDVEETPIMDGSAKFFVEAIHQAGIVEQNAPRNYLVIEEPIS